MQVTYDDAEVRALFEDFSLMQKRIGKELAKAVKKKLDAMKAANNYAIFLSTGLGKPHSLVGDHKGMYGVNVSANKRLIVQPITDNINPESLKKCDSIIIKGVEDYHGTKNEWLIP